jgi:hypothetical protein
MQYARDFSISEEDVKGRRAQLDALEQAFLQSVAETDAQEACRRATMSRSLAVATGGYTRNTPLVAGPSPALYPPSSYMSAVLPSSSSVNSFGSVPTTGSASFGRFSDLTPMMAARAQPTSNPGWTASPQVALSNPTLSGMISLRLAALASHDSLSPGPPVLGRQDSLPTAAMSLSRQYSFPSVASLANAARLSREGRLSEILSNSPRPFGLPLTNSLLPGGMNSLLNRSGNWSVDQLQAPLSGASNRTNASLHAMSLQMLQRDSLGQAATARSSAMSRNQAELMARGTELAHLRQMLEHQEATLRHCTSNLTFAQGPSLPPATSERQQTGKRSHSDARAEEKDGIEGHPAPKRGNYSGAHNVYE